MKFEHTIEVAAPKAKVQDFLNDFEKAARCLPGVEEAKAIGGADWEGRFKMRVGPLSFNINGKATIQSRDDGVWAVDGEGRDARIGAGVKATLEARLSEITPEKTEVRVDADVHFSGALAGLGQPIIRKKADSMIQEFAANLSKAIGAS